MKKPLSCFAPSPSLVMREVGMRATEDSLAAGRPLLAATGVGARRLHTQRQR